MGEMVFSPCVVRPRAGDAGGVIRMGHPLLDAYLEMVTARARWNTVLATAFDLKVFFSVVAKDPVEVTTADVLAFIKEQRAPRRGARVVRLEDGEPAWPPGRSSGAWPPSPGSMSISSCGVISVWCATLFPGAWRLAGRDNGQFVGCR